jgi:ABC-type sugar transport system substrate-binding protein
MERETSSPQLPSPKVSGLVAVPLGASTHVRATSGARQLPGRATLNGTAAPEALAGGLRPARATRELRSYEISQERRCWPAQRAWRSRSEFPPQPRKHLTILASIPDLAFPFFVYMMGQIKDEANRLGGITVIECDGERFSPKQSADLEAAITKGVDGIVINPNDFDALAPALQEAIDSKIPAVTIDRRANVREILAHVSADNVKGGEAQGELVMKLFPNGARVMYLQGQSGASPAIDRSNGLHNVLDEARDKYKFVFEDTAHFDRAQGLSMTESALAGMKSPPEVIVCANDDMALGALVDQI